MGTEGGRQQNDSSAGISQSCCTTVFTVSSPSSLRVSLQLSGNCLSILAGQGSSSVSDVTSPNAARSAIKPGIDI